MKALSHAPPVTQSVAARPCSLGLVRMQPPRTRRHLQSTRDIVPIAFDRPPRSAPDLPSAAATRCRLLAVFVGRWGCCCPRRRLQLLQLARSAAIPDALTRPAPGPARCPLRGRSCCRHPVPQPAGRRARLQVWPAAAASCRRLASSVPVYTSAQPLGARPAAAGLLSPRAGDNLCPALPPAPRVSGAPAPRGATAQATCITRQQGAAGPTGWLLGFPLRLLPPVAAGRTGAAGTCQLTTCLPSTPSHPPPTHLLSRPAAPLPARPVAP